MAGQLNLTDFIIGVVLAVLIALVAYRFRSLTVSGAIGTAITGSIIFGGGGLLFAIPLIFFFVSSLLLTRLKSERKKRAAEFGQKEGARDLRQVFANGGAAIICTIIYFATGEMKWFLAYLAAVAEASADTWGTEVGTLSTSPPISIVSFRRIEAGLSGGVTALGSIASIAGGFLTALVGGISLQMLSDIPLTVQYVTIAAGMSGICGAAVDSLLGGSIQGQFRCAMCGHTTEKKVHCGRKAEKLKGISFIDNDMVNFASTAAAVIVLLLVVC